MKPSNEQQKTDIMEILYTSVYLLKQKKTADDDDDDDDDDVTYCMSSWISDKFKFSA